MFFLSKYLRSSKSNLWSNFLFVFQCVSAGKNGVLTLWLASLASDASPDIMISLVFCVFLGESLVLLAAFCMVPRNLIAVSSVFVLLSSKAIWLGLWPRECFARHSDSRIGCSHCLYNST